MQDDLKNWAQQTPANLTVKPLAAGDIPAVAGMLAEVFADNPAYRQIFDPEDAAVGLPWMFAGSLILNQRYGIVKTIGLAEAPGRIVGTFSLLPPGAADPSVLDYIKLGVLRMPFRFGLRSLLRMFALMKENDRQVAAAMAGQPYWYLGIVAVAPAYRGRGIASSALAQAFAELGRPNRIALSTQLESNVRLYSRLGFEVRAKHYMGYKQKTIDNWIMCRSA